MTKTDLEFLEDNMIELLDENFHLSKERYGFMVSYHRVKNMLNDDGLTAMEALMWMCLVFGICFIAYGLLI